MTRSNLAVAADYADAMLVARFWKNLLFLALFVMLLIQIAVFFVVRFHTHTEAGVTQLTGATQPAILSGQDLTSQLYWLINTTDFLAIIAVAVLTVVMLLIMGIMLVGRLVGVTHVTRAFIGSVLLMVVLFPWQSIWNYPAAGTLQTDPTPVEDTLVGPRFGLPGVLYTWPELQHHAHFRTDPLTAAILGWGRFVGWPVVAIIILLMVQARSSRGLKFALGEVEINVVETGAAAGPAGNRATDA